MRQASMQNESLPEWTRSRGSMLSVCPVPGCTALTMGGTCVEHDPPVTLTFTRGRPYVAETPADVVAVPVALGAAP